MVGDRFIAISSGKSPRRIQPNGEIPFREEPELLQTLDLSQFEDRLRTVDALLTDIEQGRSRVGQFITGEKAYDDVLARIGELQAGFEAARKNNSSIGQLIYSDQLHNRIREPIMRLDATLARIQSGQGDAGRFLRDPALHQEMLASAEQLRKTIAGLRTGSFAASDTAWLDWNRRVAGMISSVDEFAARPLFSTTQAYDNLNGAAAEMRDLIRDFRKDPQKFLRVSVF
jgi:phospholipid/cholesterol/gamma-HCH transport system substrate-binding protein